MKVIVFSKDDKKSKKRAKNDKKWQKITRNDKKWQEMTKNEKNDILYNYGKIKNQTNFDRAKMYEMLTNLHKIYSE